jgi:hypothetical protein
MKEPHRVLVAAQSEASQVLQTMLTGLADLVPAYTIADALKILERNRIDLIVCTIAFDESRMVEFLQAVKGTALMGGIPFLCSRVLPSIIRDSMVGTMRDACKECGAIDLVDIARLKPDSAQAVLRAAVQSCLESKRQADPSSHRRCGGY